MQRFYNSLFLMGCFFFGLIFVTAGCDRAQGRIDFTQTQQEPAQSVHTVPSSERPLRIAFASVMSPQETRQSYQVLVDYISERLHRPAVLLQRKTYEDLNMLLAGGDVDVAFLSTGAYASYRGMQSIELLAMAQTDESIFYHTYIIVPRDSPAQDFSDLKGQVFAFTDPLSYSGRLAVDYLLLDQHTNPESYFKRCFYTYNHDKSVWAVANHLADGASVDSQIYEYTVKVNPHLTERVRIIEVLRAAPTGPVVMRSDLSAEQKQELREIFYHMDAQSQAREAMHRVMIDQFVAPVPELYEELRNRYDKRHHVSGD